MRRLVRSIVAILLSLVFAAISAALTLPNPVPAQGSPSSSGVLFVSQATSTPQPQDTSEIGSTDGIIIMSGVLAVIILIPIFMRRKAWLNS